MKIYELWEVFECGSPTRLVSWHNDVSDHWPNANLFSELALLQITRILAVILHGGNGTA